ncbi:hypothetical protein [Streptomyces griseorubiginosus]|uniref:hypothetical protein n=1 Tax=Streptomyces griseorubiginosus TaxID=67304 RepID=UPI0036E70220
MSGGIVVLVAAEDPSIASVVSQAPIADGLAALVHMVKRSATHVLGLGWRASGTPSGLASAVSRTP